MERVMERMTISASASSWDEENDEIANHAPRQELAVMLRLLCAEGFDDHLFGHVTVDQGDETFLTNPAEVGWAQVRASDLLVVDKSGHRLEGKGTPHGGLAIHFAMRQYATPGAANVVIHNHPRYATIWAARRQVPPIYDQGGAWDNSDLLLLDDYGNNLEIGTRHGKALGNAGWALLAHHGVMIAGPSLAEAYFRSVVLEARSRRAWEIQAMQGETPPPMSAEFVCKATRGGGTAYRKFWWNFAKRRQLRHDRTALE